MREIVFCYSDFDPPSYSTYWKLVEAAGFRSVSVETLDPADVSVAYVLNTIVFWGRSWPAARTEADSRELSWPEARAGIVVWNPEIQERPIPSITNGVVEVWEMDAWAAKKFGERYVPVGGHPTLDLIPLKRKTIDVAMVAYMTPRRSSIADALEERGLTVARDVQLEDKDDVLRRSKCVLHVHQLGNWPTLAPFRVIEAASARLPLITESVEDPGIFVEGEHFISAPYDQLADTVVSYLKEASAGDRAKLGDTLHEYLVKTHRFDQVVQRALEGAAWFWWT